MLRAIVFDFDGVIANSEPLHYRALRDILAEEGLPLTEADYYARYLGFDDVGTFERIGEARATGWREGAIADLIARKSVRLEELERGVSVLFPGAADAVRRLAAHVPIAIASGALGHEIRRVLDREGLTPCFSAIVSAGDTARSKPAPDPYVHALALLGSAADAPMAPADCIAIEDSVWGLESARAAGMRTVGIAQTYPAATLASADLVLASIRDLDVGTLAALCVA
jgi:beta-phosphoglucomutase-like phosphatase (HAD superfamily)